MALLDLRDNNSTAAEARISQQALAVAITNVLATLIEILDIGDVKKIGLSFALTVHALNAFQVQVKFGPASPYVTIASVAGDYTSPKGFLLAASGDLTALAIGATGWLEIDGTAISALRIQASSASVSGTLCDVFAWGG